jgi:endonuclease YncB( thermonuclease family)
MRQAFLQGAPVSHRRPFLFVSTLLLSLLLVTACQPAALAACSADRIDRHATVSYVADGDTVKLASGEWLRVIGINTPERGRDGRPDEPLAQRARTVLQQALAGHDMQIALRLGSDRRDRHGRLLGHAFLPDGRHLGETLLEQGLGFHISIPDNLWAADCLRRAEQRARQAGRGVWAMPWFAPRASHSIGPRQTGFMRIRGKVVRIGHSRKASWINLEGHVALRLANRDLPHFSGIDLESLQGKTLTVRGWFYRRKGELRTSLRHPLMIESSGIMPEAAGQ